MQSKISDVSFSIEFRFVTKIGCFVTRLCLFAHKYSSIHFLSLQWHQIYCEKDPTFISSVIFVISIMLMNVFASPYSFGNITLIPVHFSETAQQIFLIFCMKLGDYKGRKVTEPDFWQKILIWRYSRKGLQISVGWLVGKAVFSEMALRIFLIFCMKLGDYKCRKVTEPDFWKKFVIWRYSRKGLQISPKSDWFFSQKRL